MEKAPWASRICALNSMTCMGMGDSFPETQITLFAWLGLTEHHVLIRERGFQYQGQTYPNLSAIARTISDGCCTNGENFFRLDRIREAGTPKAPPRPTKRYPLTSFSRRFQRELIRAGYKAATIRVYLGHVQRFADHHMRSPERMGRLEVAQYLIHMLDDRNATLANFRAARAALCALYGVALKRPEEIETLPNRPEDLRQLAARVAAPPFSPAASATQPLPPIRDDAALPLATVS